MGTDNQDAIVEQAAPDTAPPEDAPRTGTPAFTPVADAPPALKYTDADIEQARLAAQTDLFREMEDLRSQIQGISRERDAEVARAEEARKSREAAEEKAREDEMGVRELLLKKEADWREQQSAIQAQLDAERREREKAFALLEKEREFANLERYRAEAVEANRDAIIPHLAGLVTGNSVEEVDESIAGLIELSSSILADVTQATRTVKRESSGARVTAPPAGPLEDFTGSRRLTPEDIRGMTMEEFAQHRSSLLGRGDGAGSGLFG